MWPPRLVALLLALVTLAVFLPAGGFGFVNFDDNDYITNNPPVKNGLTVAGLTWAFTHFHAGNWHPLTWLSHMTDCELFGLNAGAHHIVNVLFHAANAVLVFVLLQRLTCRTGPAAMTAALFAWHPLHVESVAWISERKDVLSTFFGLLALLSYTRYASTSQTQNPTRNVSYAAALLFFALGLMAKPMLVTLPCVLLLLDFWPLSRPAGRALFVEKWPFFLLSAASSVITIFAQRSGQAIVPLAKVPLLLRLENAPVAVTNYLRDFFWPAGLCAIYPMPKAISLLQTGLAVAGLIGLSLIAWRWRRTRPSFLTGWLWFLGMLVPVVGLLQVGNQGMADRYTYFPSIGFFFALVLLADETAGRLQIPRTLRFGCAGVAGCACIFATENQLSYWRNGESLFRRAIAVNPANAVALIDLGVALDAQGRFDEALTLYRRAEAIDPERYELHNNLGNVLDLLNRHSESLAEYREAIRLRPDDAVLHCAAGRQLAALGHPDEALGEMAEAARLDPGNAGLRLAAGKIFFALGRDADGLTAFDAAVRRAPDDFQILATVAHYLAANENAAARDATGALRLALQADAISNHAQPMVLDILGMAFAATGDFSNAVICAQNALTFAAAANLKDPQPIRQRLELYQQHRPWRESFRATNAPARN